MNSWYQRMTSMLLYVVRFFMTTTLYDWHDHEIHQTTGTGYTHLAMHLIMLV